MFVAVLVPVLVDVGVCVSFGVREIDDVGVVL